DAELLEVVLTLGACGGLADFLDGGQEQADEDRDDRDHHQQLDQRKRCAAHAAGGMGREHENSRQKRACRQLCPGGVDGRGRRGEGGGEGGRVWREEIEDDFTLPRQGCKGKNDPVRPTRRLDDRPAGPDDQPIPLSFPHRFPMLTRTLFALAVALSLATPALAQDPNFTRKEDVIYGRKWGTALTLDVFTPKEKANGKGVVYCVSGGWYSAHEGINPVYLQPFLDRGYVVFAVVHGSQPKYTIPEVLDDMHRAVRFIRSHSKEYQVDPEKLGITGGSAGGH